MSVYQQKRKELKLSRHDVQMKLEAMGNYNLTEDMLYKKEDIDNPQQFHSLDVLALSEVYGDPYLCNYFCSNDCPIGEKYVPEIKDDDDAKQIMDRISVSVDTVEKEKQRLEEILADGQITYDEIGSFVRIQRKLEKFSVVIEELQLWCEKLVAEGKIDKNIYDSYNERYKKLNL